MREIESISCSCGGAVEEQEPTSVEEIAHGCGTSGCCVNAWQCAKCGTRFTVALEAPECEW